ncbi:hypothetical protein RB2150_04733 [Rhodobacterales bacterium HTCC2150]|nr:hypothetical protein RB2150_04733 [Rhodobacterales bacterium HTCC2150] [Rhodobacteraceae bacterium HTCC2150]
MSSRNNFTALGINVAFLLGLSGAAGIAIAVDSPPARNYHKAIDPAKRTAASIALQRVTQRTLTSKEVDAANAAWSYIKNNTQSETGFVNSVDNFPSTTLWDLGSYIFALIAAEKIGVIEAPELVNRADLVVHSLSRLPLVDGLLPNKVYNTKTLAMTDYENNPSIGGIGWSALDLGRLLLALKVLSNRVPELDTKIRKLNTSWSLAEMSKNGYLSGSHRLNSQSLERRQEGRIGYEQYAARAALLYGLDALHAATPVDNLTWKKVEGVNIPIDVRRFQDFSAITPITSEPYFMMALEMGLDTDSSLHAFQVYRAQEARFTKTGIRTLVSEDHLNDAPYFAYSTVFGNGKSWAVLGEDGTEYPDFRTISLKSAFAWNAIYQTKYTHETLALLDDLKSNEDGWMAGRFENSSENNTALSLNTNAIVLESLHYTEFGSFLNSYRH